MSRSVASALGFCDGAGQTMARSIVDRGGTARKFGGAFVPVRSLFGVKGAGQVLAAATQSMAQYNAPADPAGRGSILQARPNAPADPTRGPAPNDPAMTPGAPNPQAPPAQENAGDRGKLSTPVLVGGFLILLVALYFIAK